MSYLAEQMARQLARDGMFTMPEWEVVLAKAAQERQLDAAVAIARTGLTPPQVGRVLAIMRGMLRGE